VVGTYSQDLMATDNRPRAFRSGLTSMSPAHYWVWHPPPPRRHIMLNMGYRQLLVPALVLCSGCDLLDELSQEDITETMTGSVVFQTFDTLPRTTEMDLNVCQASQDLCNRWENVQEIKVTAIVYTIRTIQTGPGVSRVALLPPSAVSYRDGTSWVYLNDFQTDDVFQRLGDPSALTLEERVQVNLGQVVKNTQNLGIRFQGWTSDRLRLDIDVAVTIVVTVGL